MKKSQKKRIIASAMILAALAGPMLSSGQTAEKQKKNQPPAQLPIVIQADKVYVNDTSGDFNAGGNVSVEQGSQTMLSDAMRGNSKQGMVWIDDKATFLQPGTRIIGNSAVYDYKNRTGTINQAKGNVEKELVAGQNINLLPDKVIIQDGMMTKCPANVPDYHISAERVEIWPGKKMIAYNAKFWVKNTVILALPKYQQSLDKDKEQSFMPRIGYESGDGVFFSQQIGYPIGNNVGFYGDLTYYSDSGFKPQYRIDDTEKNYTLGLDYGHYRDDDGNWIKKEPELNFRHSNRIGKSPLNYSFTAIYGKWSDRWKTSWHQDYNLYFSHDTIKLGEGLNFNIGTGFEYILESYNSSAQAVFRYDLGLSKTLSRKFDVWTWYHHVNNNISLFNYNNVDVNRELVPGITYKPDRLNTFTYYQSYDLANNRVFERYYVWNRNLHCWEASIEYKEKEEKLTVKLHTARW